MGEPRTIFVFGSNLAGRHGKGSALEAVRNHGAVYGQGQGLQGNSYAIPTKDERLMTLSIQMVAWHIGRFVGFAYAHPELTFNVVKVGCGLAGFKEDDIRGFFAPSPPNVNLPEGWR